MHDDDDTLGWPLLVEDEYGARYVNVQPLLNHERLSDYVTVQCSRCGQDLVGSIFRAAREGMPPTSAANRNGDGSTSDDKDRPGFSGLTSLLESRPVSSLATQHEQAMTPQTTQPLANGLVKPNKVVLFNDSALLHPVGRKSDRHLYRDQK